MKNSNTLTLRKCAYIYDSTYRMSWEDGRKIQEYLKRFYYKSELLEQEFEYMFCRNQIVVEILGTPHFLNDLQIAHINGQLEDSPINYRKIIEGKDIIENTPNFHLFCGQFLYHNKFSTFSIEPYTAESDLGFIRANFKRETIEFAVDCRTNLPITSGRNGRHKELTWDHVKKALTIKSKEASNAFDEVKKAIINV